MQNELSLLIQLQTFDTEIDTIAGEILHLESAVKDKNVQLDSLKLGSKMAKESMASLQLKKKQLEADAETQEKLVKKHQAELNSLKSNDAYKAMLSEIDNAKKAQIGLEDQILVVMEQLEQAEQRLKEVEAKLKNEEAVIRADIKKIQGDIAQAVSAQQSKQNERESFSATVPDPVRRQYDSLRKTRGGVAIVAVVNNTCSGCQMALTQGKIVDIKKAKAMVLCESCSRILFMPEAPTAASVAAETPPLPAA